MKFRSVHITLYGKYTGPREKRRDEGKICHAIIGNGSSWAVGKFPLEHKSYDEWRSEIKKTGKPDIFEAFAYALVSMIKKEHGDRYGALINYYDITKAVVDANISGKKYSKTIPIVFDNTDKVRKDIESEFNSYEDFEEPGVVKINEDTLRQIVAESVKKVLNEGKKEDFKKYFIYVCKSGMSIQSLLNKVVQILGYESLFKLVEGIYSEISDYDPSNYPEI